MAQLHISFAAQQGWQVRLSQQGGQALEDLGWACGVWVIKVGVSGSMFRSWPMS